MIYATPEAFRQALEARIRRTARERAQPIERVRQLLVFDRLLARVFTTLGDRATVKGGVVLELRLDRSRTTRDLDLGISGGADEVIAALRRAGALDLGDFLSFVIDINTAHPDIEGEGIVYTGRRFRAEARLAGKNYGEPFGIDAAFGDVLTTAPDMIDGTDFFAFAGIARARYRVYPREAHVAEKLHAYTLPRKRENSRVKDLPDFALLATTGTFDAVELRRAIDTTFGFRQTHPVPTSLPAPPSSWGAEYARLAARDELPWRDVSSVTDAARAFLDPILAATDGIWDPIGWRWVPRRAEHRGT